MEEARKIIYKLVAERKISPREAATIVNRFVKRKGDVVKGDIAIIGMAGRFPMAKNLDEFWQNLVLGRNCIGYLPEQRWKDIDDFLNLNRSKYTAYTVEDIYGIGGYLEDIDQFDAEFFNIASKEAQYMDPLQRLFLETAWLAIEDAGYSIDIYGTNTGVYVGKDHMSESLYKCISTEWEPFIISGCWPSILASRVSYMFNLSGPSMVMDTACSSGLIAVHQACEDLRLGKCGLAVAGGIHIEYRRGKSGLDMVESKDGKVRAFDKFASGTVWSEGVGILILKPLSKAIADRDNIHAIIKGSAINNNGTSNGIISPNAKAQEDVLASAWNAACIDPETISYIEMHGTGTVLGDPIEVKGLVNAMNRYSSKKQFCGIGSVKTNIGHAVAASGIASIIKVVLSLKNEAIPPNINFETPNPYIDFSDSPVYVVDKLTDWSTGSLERRGGASSFGFNGTNCHIVLEEAPKITDIERGQGLKYHMLTITAKSLKVLGEMASRYYNYVCTENKTDYRDICYTSCTARRHHGYRLALIGKNREDIREKLCLISQTDPLEFYNISKEGIHYGEHKLVVNSRETRKGILNEHEKRNMNNSAKEYIMKLFAVDDEQYGILNEICRLYVAGAELEWKQIYKDQYKKVCLPQYSFEKSRYWAKNNLNEMLNKRRRQAAIRPLADEGLLDSIYIESIDKDIFVMELDTKTHWILSEHKIRGYYVVPGTFYLEMARKYGTIYLGNVPQELKNVTFLSPLTLYGDDKRQLQIIINKRENHLEFIAASKSGSGFEWVRHAIGEIHPTDVDRKSQTVSIHEKITDKYDIVFNPFEGDFEFGYRWSCIKAVYPIKNDICIYLELPEEYKSDLDDYFLHPSLVDCAVNWYIQRTGEGLYLPYFYKSIKIYGPTPAKIYSYIRKRKSEDKNTDEATFDITLMDENGIAFVEIEGYSIKKINRDEQLRLAGNMYYETAWVPAKQPDELKIPEGARILVLKGGTPVGREIVQKLRERGIGVIEVDTGREYERKAEDRFVINETEEDYGRLLNDIKEKGLWKVIHLSTLTGREEIADEDMLEDSQKKGVYSLFYLARGLLNSKMSNDLEIILVSDYTAEVTGYEERLNPHNASLFGLGKVIGNEYGHLKCRCIDIDGKTGTGDIISEIMSGAGAYKIAFRDGIRYTEEFRRMGISETSRLEAEIMEHGVYVITGGTGGIGLEIGKYLASKNKVKLCLVNRSSMPEREEWGNILERSVDVKECRKIKAIRYMEDRGTEVNCYSADVSDMEKMRKVLEDIRSRYGKIDGVIHGAGIAGDGFIIRKDEEVFSRVMKPKVQGTWILDRLTKDDKLDFFIMFSSIESLIGNMGQGDYTSANCYLDAFSGYRRKNGKRSLTINWPAWKETGMAADYGATGARGLFKPIATDRAIRCFEDVITRDTGRVVIGELDFEAMGTLADDKEDMELSEELKSAMRKIRSNRKANVSAGTEKTLTRVVLKGKGEDGYNEIEMKVAEVWAQVLGLEEINAYDSFRDIGGDSILATHLLKKMEQVFPGILDISDIFTYGTVSELAGYIESKLGKKEDGAGERDTQGIMDLLSKGEISVEEAGALIKKQRLSSNK